MGNVLKNMVKENHQYHVVYLEKNKTLYSIVWHRSYADLLLVLKNDFQYHHSNRLYFEDGTGKKLHVTSESMYQALVPKYKKYEPDIEIYYVTLELY